MSLNVNVIYCYNYNNLYSYSKFDLINIISHCNSGDDSDSDENSEDSVRSYRPVVCMGRQPHSDVYVLGPSLQFRSDGTAIPPAEQEYVWVERIMKKLRIGNILHPLSCLPTVSEPLNKLLTGLACVSGNNLPSAVFILGKWLTDVLNDYMRPCNESITVVSTDCCYNIVITNNYVILQELQ